MGHGDYKQNDCNNLSSAKMEVDMIVAVPGKGGGGMAGTGCHALPWKGTNFVLGGRDDGIPATTIYDFVLLVATRR